MSRPHDSTYGSGSHADAARQPRVALVMEQALGHVTHHRNLRAALDATPINYDSLGAAYNHKPAGSGWLDRQKFRMNQAAFHAAAELVTWSEWARRSLIDDYGADPARIRVLAPGAAQAYFHLGQRRQAASTQEHDKVRVLFVGGDFLRKGGPRLLECLTGQLAERVELHLVTSQPIAGTPPNVFVHRGLGPNSPKLLQLFAEADLFVLPSFGECLAVVLMEATAAGLPVITTNVGALGEAVREGESGLLVEAGDGAALRAALERLVDDADLRRRMGRAGHALARQKFDAHANNRALLGLLAELAQTGRDSRSAA